MKWLAESRGIRETYYFFYRRTFDFSWNGIYATLLSEGQQVKNNNRTKSYHSRRGGSLEGSDPGGSAQRVGPRRQAGAEWQAGWRGAKKSPNAKQGSRTSLPNQL